MSSNRYKSFKDIRSIVDKGNRRELPIGRNGKMVTARKFWLSNEEVATYREMHEQGDKLPNPHNRGFDFYLIETLKDLGLNQAHKDASVKTRFRELASRADSKNASGRTFWERWSKKKSRNKKTGKDWIGRFNQNIEVMQRFGGFSPYGQRLMDIGKKVLRTKGACIDVVQVHGERMIKLNTDSSEPVNDFKGRRSVDETPKRKPRSKARKAKTKVAAPAAEPVAELATA